MANINSVDISRLKNGEINLGVGPLSSTSFNFPLTCVSRHPSWPFSLMAVLSLVRTVEQQPVPILYVAVYLCASRVSLHPLQANRVTDKLTHIHDRIYCCRSGSAADTQAIADIVHQHAQVYTSVYGSPPSVATAAALFEKLCYENKDQLSAGIIVAGWDKENGGSVYNIPLGGGMFQQPWAIGGTCSYFCGKCFIDRISGSGSTYVYGYCDATYQEGWSEEETVKFVKNSEAFFSAATFCSISD